jgi:hypothetical protein
VSNVAGPRLSDAPGFDACVGQTGRSAGVAPRDDKNVNNVYRFRKKGPSVDNSSCLAVAIKKTAAVT